MYFFSNKNWDSQVKTRWQWNSWRWGTQYGKVTELQTDENTRGGHLELSGAGPSSKPDKTKVEPRGSLDGSMTQDHMHTRCSCIHPCRQDHCCHWHLSVCHHLLQHTYSLSSGCVSGYGDWCTLPVMSMVLPAPAYLSGGCRVSFHGNGSTESLRGALRPCDDLFLYPTKHRT